MSDTLEIIKCPACECEMTKIFIPEKAINVDICADGCGGIYFDNQEIREFSAPTDDISEIKSLLDGKNFMPVDESKTRICPSCNTPMAKTNVFGIQIDTCYKCGGLFLDNGEFEIVKSKFKKKSQKPVVNLNNSETANEEVRKIYNEMLQGKDNEKFIQDAGYAKFSQLFFGGRHRYGLLRFLADLIFY